MGGSDLGFSLRDVAKRSNFPPEETDAIRWRRRLDAFLAPFAPVGWGDEACGSFCTAMASDGGKPNVFVKIFQRYGKIAGQAQTYVRGFADAKRS